MFSLGYPTLNQVSNLSALTGDESSIRSVFLTATVKVLCTMLENNTLYDPKQPEVATAAETI